MGDAHQPARRGGERKDRTAEAVAGQVGGMAAEQYELGVRHGEGGTLIPRVLWPASLMKCLGWLKHENAGGADIFIRPRGSAGLVLVDDVSAEALARMDADGMAPAVITQTSPGNHQAWVRIAAAPIAEHLATAAAAELARRYAGDRGAVSWRQYGRLAGFTNRKAKHRQADGHYPFVLQLRSRPGVAPAAADLLGAVSASVTAPARSSVSSASFSAPPRGLVCVLIEEYRRAVVEHCRRFSVDDWSVLDWMVTHDLAVAHPDATASELAAAIAAASPNVADRHRGRVDKYALHTAQKVLAALSAKG